ncbi:MAG TPA: AAA family ATPase, partial [Hyphomicrobiales bacterium]|nr:AAA family ATPase [Hyphomicrobiales bacterium]
HAVSRLLGAPPGYIGFEEGGQLTEAVRRKPYCVLLFDEIEKAHPDVFNVLLQLLDDGRLTDSHGRTVNFQNTVVIMTSNIGSPHLIDGVNSQGEISEAARAMITEELRARFRPEFLNRVDDTVLFKPLKQSEIAGIAVLMLESLKQRLAAMQIALDVTDDAKAFLAREGYDPVFGARPLKRFIQHEIETPVARLLIGNEAVAGNTIRVNSDGASLSFDVKA